MSEHIEIAIINGLVVTHESAEALDVSVKNGKIHHVVPRGELKYTSCDRTIDAKGALVTVSTVPRKPLLRWTSKFINPFRND